MSVGWTTIPVLRNSIVATNSGPQCSIYESIDVSYSLLGDGFCLPGPTRFVGNLIGVDPKLSPLSYQQVEKIHLGATQAHALLAESPTIDRAGDDCISEDQLGKSRPIDGNGDGVARCDMGVFEYQPPSPIRTDLR